MASFQELSEEAFRDLLAKHGRAADLRSQLKKSAGAADAPAASTDEDRRENTRNTGAKDNCAQDEGCPKSSPGR